MSDDDGRRGVLGLLLFAVAVVVAYGVVGVVAGLVWEAVWTPPTQVVQQHHVYYLDYASLRRVFSGTGLYVIVGGIASAVTTLVVVLVARGRELVALASVLVGSVLASVVMRQVGVSRGPTDPTTLAHSKPNGTRLPGSLVVSGHTPYLVWPIVALIVLALVFFAWSLPSEPGRTQAAPDDPAEADVPSAPAG
jgi:hypothetical protein